MTPLNFGQFGVLPRTTEGLIGILTAPIIHGSWSHLISNTPAIIVLGIALLFAYPRSSKILLPAIYLGAGLLVWLFGRPVFHIGASGLTFGAMFFIFTIGILRWDPRAMALSMLVFFLYGSMIWGVFPHEVGISFETHLAGATIGILLAIVLRHRDKPPPRKRYSWEEEEDKESTLNEAGVLLEEPSNTSP